MERRTTDKAESNRVQDRYTKKWALKESRKKMKRRVGGEGEGEEEAESRMARGEEEMNGAVMTTMLMERCFVVGILEEERRKGGREKKSLIAMVLFGQEETQESANQGGCQKGKKAKALCRV